MTSGSNGSRELSDRARSAGRRAHASDWADHAARAGLIAYGVVHLLIGVLAVQLAFGDRSDSPDATGALQALAGEPFGEVMLWVVALGLLLLVAWQALEAAVGYHDEDGFERLRHRVASGAKALIYAFLGITGIRIALSGSSSGGSSSGGSGGGSGGKGSGGGGSGSGDSGTDTMTATLMDAPGGQLLVGAVGLTIIAFGGYLVVRGWSDKIPDDLDARGSSGTSGSIAVAIGRIGYTAKGIAFGIVGVLFIQAAIEHEAKESGGLDQALREVLDQPFGPLLLCLIGAGIAAYGVFAFAQARYLDR